MRLCLFSWHFPFVSIAHTSLKVSGDNIEDLEIELKGAWATIGTSVVPHREGHVLFGEVNTHQGACKHTCYDAHL